MDLTLTKVVTHDSLPGVSVTVRPANYKIGLTRAVLIGQEQAVRAKDADLQDAAQLAGIIGNEKIYPSLIAATVDHTGFDAWPPTADAVLDLPEGFVTAWEVAVYALNPQWVEKVPDEQEKKG